MVVILLIIVVGKLFGISEEIIKTSIMWCGTITTAIIARYGLRESAQAAKGNYPENSRERPVPPG